MRNEGYGRGPERADVMVQPGEVQTLQVRHISRNVKRDYLSFGTICDFMAAKVAVHNQAALSWNIALPQNVLICLVVSNCHGQLGDEMAALLGQCVDAFEPPN
jgi:hypothetical protein